MPMSMSATCVVDEISQRYGLGTPLHVSSALATLGTIALDYVNACSRPESDYVLATIWRRTISS
jgi:hypothetical protein